MDLASKIEALLFWKAEPLSRKKLEQIFGVDGVLLNGAFVELRERLKGRGICLMENNDSFTVATASGASDFIEKFKKDEMSGDLSRVALETLTVILYCGPISRRDIDYIRGVNSAFTLRNLLVRDLAERVPNPKDDRSFLYQPTFNLLSFLAVARREELPEYEIFRKEFEVMRLQGENTETKEAQKIDTTPTAEDEKQ